MNKLSAARGVLMLATLGTITLAPYSDLHAADHTEPPGNGVTGATNIGDFFAWHANGKLTAVITVGGAAPPVDAQAGTYDADALYGIHIDTNGDNVDDETVWVRFGQNGSGAWGIQVKGVPGADGDIVGPVEQTLSSGPARVFAGLRDDPFFFDLEGFIDTVMTGSLQFASLVGDGPRDSLAGTNATAIVIELDLADLGSDNLQIWATASSR